MKRFIRNICVAMAFVILTTSVTYAATPSTGEVSPQASSFFMSYDSSLYKTSSHQFQVWFDVVALRGMDELGTSLIRVQRSPDGVTWTTVQTYTPENYPQMICEDTGFHMDCVTFTGSMSYYYRAYVVFYAKNSTGIGKISEYSEVLYL